MARAKPRYDVSCKLGTIPKLVRVHGSDVIEVDRMVRVKESEGDRWKAVLVTRINDDGYFFADLFTSFAPESAAQLPAGEYAYAE